MTEPTIERQVFLGHVPTVHQDWERRVCSSCHTVRSKSTPRCPTCNNFEFRPFHKNYPTETVKLHEYQRKVDEGPKRATILYECKSGAHPPEHKVRPVLGWKENRDFRFRLWARCPECGHYIRRATQALINDLGLIEKPEQVPTKPKETPSLFGDD
jgi:hypothetical protein